MRLLLFSSNIFASRYQPVCKFQKKKSIFTRFSNLNNDLTSSCQRKKATHSHRQCAVISFYFVTFWLSSQSCVPSSQLFPGAWLLATDEVIRRPTRKAQRSLSCWEGTRCGEKSFHSILRNHPSSLLVWRWTGGNHRRRKRSFQWGGLLHPKSIEIWWWGVVHHSRLLFFWEGKSWLWRLLAVGFEE